MNLLLRAWNKNKFIIITFLLIIPIIITMAIHMNLNAVEFKTCYLDAFCTVSGMLYDGIIPITVFLCLYYLRTLFQIPVMIRYVNIRKIWIVLCKKILLVSFLMCCYIFFCTYVLNHLFVHTFFNWDIQNSIYYFYCSSVRTDAPYPLLIVIFFSSLFFTILIFNLMTLLFYWVTGSVFSGYVITILFVGYDLFSQYPLLKSRVRADFKTWRVPVNYVDQFILPIIIICVLVLAGYLLVKERDFIKQNKVGEQ